LVLAAQLLLPEQAITDQTLLLLVLLQQLAAVDQV
jgi:hypothetical protein